jgi:hypothetical protein
MLSSIQTIEEVKLFARLLVKEGLSFHPDDDFSEYVVPETQRALYSSEEAEIRNFLMSQCFKVCESSNVDIYDLMGDILLTETGMAQFIPLSTEVSA